MHLQAININLILYVAPYQQQPKVYVVIIHVQENDKSFAVI